MSRPGAALDPAQWLALPALAAIVGAICLAVPVRVGGLRLPEPVFPMALAFSWAVIRPSVLGPFFLLALGLFLDLFWGGRLGVWGLSLLAAYGLTLSGRSLMAGQGLAVMGAWYIAACVLGLGFVFLFATIVAHQQPNLMAVVWQLVWTVGLFPAVVYLTNRFEDADVRFR
jgi:rod shape-determining protein MreD